MLVHAVPLKLVLFARAFRRECVNIIGIIVYIFIRRAEDGKLNVVVAPDLKAIADSHFPVRGTDTGIKQHPNKQITKTENNTKAQRGKEREKNVKKRYKLHKQNVPLCKRARPLLFMQLS